ncbi:site-specific integrase [Flagellimonas oceanensis]|uniref:site-specific integrase n=1 Tax=Flagellimonas oceanensis TaxID=2499163 RepID=UPI003BA8CD93
MGSSNSFSIRFWIKKRSRKKNGRIPIYARIRFSGKYCDISVNRTTLEERWCPELGKIDHRAKDANGINRYLDEVHSKLLDCHRQLLAEGEVISAKKIKLRFLGKDQVVNTLKDIIEFHKIHEMPKLAQGTIKNYSSTEAYLLRFIKYRYHTTDIKLSFIDYGFLMEFESYLRNCKPLVKHIPLSNNGIMKHMERFKKLVTLAFKFGSMPRNPFTLYNMKFESYDSDFLEEDEIEKIKQLKLEEDGLNLVRDLFLFSCYTGLSYVEVKMLRERDIVKGFDGDQWINVKRKKTKTPVKVPLLHTAERILKKYKGHPRIEDAQLLLPVYSNQKVNRNLKIIAKRAGIDKNITFHVARHTFATTITLMNNVPIETVSKLLGHTKLSTTQKYARVLEKKISKDMAQLKKELNKKKEEAENKAGYSGNLRIIR